MGENRRVPTTRTQQQDEQRPPPAGSGTAATQARTAEPDGVCAAATSVARSAAEELADPGTVGEHLEVLANGDRLVTHHFASLARGYRGWHWAVTLARAPRSRTATVCETVLLPGAEAVLAPVWVPWSDRLEPGDLGPADVLPHRPDDPYLDEGYEQAEEDGEVDRVALWELGLGRARVLGRQGREAAATRWYTGAHGPTADEAVHAAAACSTCGYFVHLAGTLRQAFGVCAHEWSPSDGQVVSIDHGCGAHSETDLEQVEPMPLPGPILDELGAEAVVVSPSDPDAGAADASEPDPVPGPEPESVARAEAGDGAQPVSELAPGPAPGSAPEADLGPTAEAGPPR